MNTKLSGFITLILLSGLLYVSSAFISPSAQAASCGVKGKPPCAGKVDATRVGAAKKWGCKGRNVYFTPKNGGECWSCPSGYRRGVKAIHKSKSCYKKGWGGGKVNATFVKSAYGCQRGQFHSGKSCYTCPAGSKKVAVLGAFNPGQACKFPKAGYCASGLDVTRRAPSKLGKSGPKVCGEKFNAGTEAAIMAATSEFTNVSAAVVQFLNAYKYDRGSKKQQIHQFFKRGNVIGAGHLLNDYPPFNRLQERIQQLGGYQTLTIGAVGDVQVGVGYNSEEGIAISMGGDGAFRRYFSEGVTAGLAAGFDIGLNIGLWTVGWSDLRGFSHGAVSSLSPGGSIGGGVWYSYYPEKPLGFTFTAGMGIGFEAWEYNQVETKLHNQSYTANR